MIIVWARQKSENLEGTLGESNALPASPLVSFYYIHYIGQRIKKIHLVYQ